MHSMNCELYGVINTMIYKFVALFNRKETSRALISAIVLSDDSEADLGSHVGSQVIAGCKR